MSCPRKGESPPVRKKKNKGMVRFEELTLSPWGKRRFYVEEGRTPPCPGHQSKKEGLTPRKKAAGKTFGPTPGKKGRRLTSEEKKRHLKGYGVEMDTQAGPKGEK